MYKKNEDDFLQKLFYDSFLKIFIASDHAGFSLKQSIIEKLSNAYQILDLGTASTIPCDYPVFAHKLVNMILTNSSSKSSPGHSEKLLNNINGNIFGVLICGTGIGMSIAANRYRGIRAALCFNEEMAKFSRKHNNANVIILGAKVIDCETAIKCLTAFVSTKFDAEERHSNRLHMIDELINGEKL